MFKYSRNPIITRDDIPDISPDLIDVTSVFNPGAAKINDKYLLLLRVQNRARETFLLKALSSDGYNFSVDSSPVNFSGIKKFENKIFHIYDPRIVKIEDTYFIMLALDLDIGCRLGLVTTSDFEEYSDLKIVSDDDTRNGVLFPEKINNKYLRLERPNNVVSSNAPATGDTIFISESENLLKWKRTKAIMKGRCHYWDEVIGPGTPPVKTRKGWLVIYHGIATHLANIYIYQAGVVLLDLYDPSKIIARGRYNILEPRELYELTGQVPNVVFPTGIIVESYDDEGFALSDSEVKVYYGAADTCVALAISTIDELLKACFVGGSLD